MKEWVTVLRAADAAARWHVHQRRKGSAQEPYINHLLEVASLVTEATHGKDPDLVIAALLHDAVEDQEVPSDLIVREFGPKVAAIVPEVTDDKTVGKAERKRRQVETAGKKSDQAKMLKLADKTSNLRAIAFSPSPGWSVILNTFGGTLIVRRKGPIEKWEESPLLARLRHADRLQEGPLVGQDRK